MKNYLGRVVMLVDDYEAAADFFKELWLSESLDHTTKTGQRFSTWAVAGQMKWPSGF